MHSVYKYSAVWCAFAGASLAALAQEAPDELTLDAALARALQQNPRLEAFDWERRAADARIVQAGLRPNPELELEFEDVRLGEGPNARTRTSSFGATVTPTTVAVPVGGGNTLNLPAPALGSSRSIERRRESGARSGFREAEITVGLSQTIEVGGKRAKRLRLAERERDLASWDYEAARADVVAETVAAFVTLLAAQERLALENELLDLSAETERAIGVRVDAGKVSPLELNKAAIAHANERIAVNDAEHALAAARTALVSTWAGREALFTKAAGALAEPYDIPPFPALLDAIEANPDIARWADEIAAREAHLALERAKRTPDPTLWLGIRSAGLPQRDATDVAWNRGAGVNVTRQQLDFDETRDETLVFGVRWPLPIFNRNQGAMEEAQHLVSKTAAQRRAAESDVFATLSQAYEALAAAKSRAATLQQDILGQARETYEKTLRGYEAGKFELLDVLDAQRAWFRARNDYLAAVAAFHHAAVAVERLSGIAIGPGQSAEENNAS